MSKIYQKKNLDGKTRVRRLFGGFTLIELLVVVLIIGILAAVAVPTYEKAVARAKVAKMLPWFKKLKEGREMYLMNGGRYACLDLSRYLDAAGVSYYRFRCSGASEDGSCNEASGWCNGTLYIDEKTKITNFLVYASYAYAGPAKSKGLTDFQILLHILPSNNTSPRKGERVDLYCHPLTAWGRTVCLQMASSPEIKQCYANTGECYLMDF